MSLSRQLCLVIVLALLVSSNDAYPMLIELEEEGTRCIKYTVPEHDDAHVVFLPIPSAAGAEEYMEDFPDWPDQQKRMEDWYVGQMITFEKQRKKKNKFPRKLLENPPEDIAKMEQAFLDAEPHGTKEAGVQVIFSNPETGSSRKMAAFWFTPIVLNNIRELGRGDEGSNPLEGFEICFKYDGEGTPVQMIVETAMASGVPVGLEEEGDDATSILESSHLTPLSEQLSESIAAAQKVIREMNFMERREQRMRLTADSINARVKNFSYISVLVLLVVTYLQVTYLKRYFHKKKLL